MDEHFSSFKIETKISTVLDDRIHHYKIKYGSPGHNHYLTNNSHILEFIPQRIVPILHCVSGYNAGRWMNVD